MSENFQCRLSRQTTNGMLEQVAWINERGAKVGAVVELKDTGEYWQVMEVYPGGIEDLDLREHQRLNRGSLLSIKK